MRAELAQAAGHLPTPDLFREVERLQTSAFIEEKCDEYWAAVDMAMVDVLSITIGAWGDAPFSFRGAVHDLGEWQRRFRHARRFTLVDRAADMMVAKRARRTGVLLGFQNCTQLDGDLRNLETFYAFGIRMIQLTYNEHGPAGSGCTAATDRGLTAIGRELVNFMNKLGIIIDVSHCGPRTALDAIKTSRAPVAVSHAACSAVHPHARNKDDDLLRALRDTGGYIGICSVPAFLASQPNGGKPSVEAIVRHIQHALSIAGEASVGIGTDWGVADSPAALTERLQAEAQSRGFRQQDAFDFTQQTEGFESWATGWPRITTALAQAALPDQVIGRVLGDNFRRVFSEVERAAGT
jgi:membrane dipeptidase